MSQAERLQFVQPADLLRQVLIRLLSGDRGDINDAMPAGIVDELAVEPRPVLALDLTVEAASNIEIGTQAELLGDKIPRPRPYSLADVVPRDDEVFSVVSAPAQDDVDMRIVGIPVIDADPVEPGAEVVLPLPSRLALFLAPGFASFRLFATRFIVRDPCSCDG